MKKIITILLVITSTGFFAQDFKFGKVSKAELEEKFHPTDSTANAAYLYKFRKTYFMYSPNDGFILMSEIHVRIKIYNKEGFDKATKEIRYYRPDKGFKDKISNIKATTYNLVDGKIKKVKLGKKGIFDTKLSKFYHSKKLTMPNIMEGSVIEYKYKTSSRYYSDIEDLQFQHDVPVNKLDYSIAIPEYFRFNQTSKGYYGVMPTTRTKKDKTSFSSVSRSSGAFHQSESTTSKIEYTVYISDYKADNIPALKDDEPYVNFINNYRGGVKYELKSIQYPNSTPQLFSTSWDKVAFQIYKSQRFGGELNKSGYYKDDLASVVASANKEVEKIAAIYQYVKSKVKWNGYFGMSANNGVRKAYKDGVGNSGDINLMLTSMLRSAGINANPVLVSTRSNGVPLFPTLDGFNYVITIVNVGDGYVLLDATEKYGLPNILPVRALNWNGRVVRKDGTSSWIPLVSSKHSTEDHKVSATITPDMTVEGMLSSKFSNLSALNFRNRYNIIKEEEISSKLEEDYSIEIENFRIGNKYSLGKPVTQMVKFSSEDLIEEISNKIYINPMLFFTMSQNPFKAVDRKFPVDFDSPWKRKYTISIQIPEGYSVESLPKPYAVGMRENRDVFKYQLKQVGNKITLVCSLQFNDSRVNPKDYLELKEFFRKMVEKQTEKIVLTKS